MQYDYIELPNGTVQKLSRPQILGHEPLPEGKRLRYTTLLSDGESNSSEQTVTINGESFSSRHGKHWKTSPDGIQRLHTKGRIQKLGSTIWYKRYVEDFPAIPMNDRWGSLQIGVELTYVVQTSPVVIQRCMLMTTDPGDLVLDITCGSGTTAYVAEQWGRRWITCDTSRVAITLAKQHLMTAIFDYYKPAHEEQGVSSGFISKDIVKGKCEIMYFFPFEIGFGCAEHQSVRTASACLYPAAFVHFTHTNSQLNVQKLGR